MTTVKYDPTVDRSPQDEELATALIELSCHVEGIRATASRALGLTPQQAQLLTSVAAGPLTHGELATRLHCDKTNVTGLVDRLERRALVRRRADLADRRVAQVSLTDDGVELVGRFREAVTAAVTDRLEGWPTERRRELAGLARGAIDAVTGGSPTGAARSAASPPTVRRASAGSHAAVE
jgi:DNA-binding MarR family transcriptional regulator